MALEFVVDANIIFSALLAKKATRAPVFDSRLKLYCPEFLLVEVRVHVESDEEMKAKLRLMPEEAKEVLSDLMQNIEVSPVSRYSGLLEKAIEICPDEYDAPYFALAMALKIPLWSNDKRLAEQERVSVLATKDLLHLVGQPKY